MTDAATLSGVYALIPLIIDFVKVRGQRGEEATASEFRAWLEAAIPNLLSNVDAVYGAVIAQKAENYEQFESLAVSMQGIKARLDVIVAAVSPQSSVAAQLKVVGSDGIALLERIYATSPDNFADNQELHFSVHELDALGRSDMKNLERPAERLHELGLVAIKTWSGRWSVEMKPKGLLLLKAAGGERAFSAMLEEIRAVIDQKGDPTLGELDDETCQRFGLPILLAVAEAWAESSKLELADTYPEEHRRIERITPSLIEASPKQLVEWAL